MLCGILMKWALFSLRAAMLQDDLPGCSCARVILCTVLQLPCFHALRHLERQCTYIDAQYLWSEIIAQQHDPA